MVSVASTFVLYEVVRRFALTRFLFGSPPPHRLPALHSRGEP